MAVRIATPGSGVEANTCLLSSVMVFQTLLNSLTVNAKVLLKTAGSVVETLTRVACCNVCLLCMLNGLFVADMFRSPPAPVTPV